VLVSDVRSIVAYAAPADLRKGFNGLSAMVREELGLDPTDGTLYLFVSRNRIRAKILLWDGTGLCVFAKRLEEGRFAALWERDRGGRVELSASELSLFLEGSHEVARRSLSPPRIDPNRKILSDLRDSIRSCSTSNQSAIRSSCGPSAEPTRARIGS
jgi:transposase